MRRVTLMLGTLALLVGLLAGPVAAAPGGNAANAAKCKEGGYLDYTDANGNAFKNAGQCTSYAARGGQLVPVPTADISLDQASGTISLTGFTPNSQITLLRHYYPIGFGFMDTFGPTDATGAYSIRGWFNFCWDPSNTRVEVLAIDDAGVRVEETFALSCGFSRVASSSDSDRVGE